MKWIELPLAQITKRFISGGTPNTKISEYWTGDIPWITGADIFDGSVTIGRRYINELAVNNSATNIVPKNSLLMVTRTGVGKIALAPVDIAISQDFTGIVLKKGIEPKYALEAIRSRMPSLLAVQRGATIKGVTRNDVANLKIPLPPISEQRRIVEILDQADRLRKLRADANTKAARILPALFYKMFGDPATNPKGWPVKQLGEVTTGNPQYGANASATYWTDGSPRYVRITDITDDGRLLKTGVVTLNLDDWAPYHLTPGDLLFARSGNTVGKTYLYQPQDGLCAYAGYLIRFKADQNQVLPWYLFALTQTGYYRSWVEARKRVAGQPNINGKEYASLQIPSPPIPLQEAFVEKIERLIDLREKRNKMEKKIQQLFSVLLHRAFTGDLTAKWRETNIKELLQEKAQQSSYLEKVK